MLSRSVAADRDSSHKLTESQLLLKQMVLNSDRSEHAPKLLEVAGRSVRLCRCKTVDTCFAARVEGFDGQPGSFDREREACGCAASRL